LREKSAARCLHGDSALDRNRAVNIVQANSRAPGPNLAAEIVTDILAVIHGQTEIVGDGAVQRAGFDLRICA